MKIEKGLNDFLTKRYGSFEAAVVTEDNGKTVHVTVDFDDDETVKAVINRRKGYNGNYRVVCEC